MIDYEDQLAKEYEDARDELYKQVNDAGELKLNLIVSNRYFFQVEM